MIRIDWRCCKTRNVSKFLSFDFCKIKISARIVLQVNLSVNSRRFSDMLFIRKWNRKIGVYRSVTLTILCVFRAFYYRNGVTLSTLHFYRSTKTHTLFCLVKKSLISCDLFIDET